jgi:uncharacterized protein involved in outer membrane biogenesis
MRTLFKLVLGVVVIVVIGAIAMYVYIDQIARRAVERGSEYALGVDTTVQSARVRLLGGRLVLHKVHVANPEGFSAPHFLQLEEGDLAVALASLRSQPVHVTHLALEGVDLNLQKSADGANYQVIFENLRKLQEGRPPDAEGKRFVIDRLDIRKVDVHVDLLGLGDATRVNVPINDIQLTGVGAEDGRGVTISELSGLVVQAVFTSAIQTGGSLMPADIQAELQSRLEGLTSLDRLTRGINLGRLQERAEKLGLPKDVTDKARGKVDDAVDKFEDVLKDIGSSKPRNK